jgi:hypothetical protein
LKTHTIRNKHKGTPIVTLTQPFLEKLTPSSGWVVRVVLDSLLTEISRLLGRNARLDLEQESALVQGLASAAEKRAASHAALRARSEATGIHDSTSHALRAIFIAGLQATPARDIEDVLALATRFDNQLPTAALSTTVTDSEKANDQ